MGSTAFRDPQALSSTLTALGSPKLKAFRSLNTVEPLVSVSNYYIDLIIGLLAPCQINLLLLGQNGRADR